MHYLINFLISFIFVSCLSAGEFYAIVVGDTSDPVIASTVKYDLKVMKKLLREISEYSEQHLHLTVFENKTTLQPLLTNLLDLKVTEHDVIFFYQSSHGFHASWQKTAWPMLYYGTDGSSINFDAVNDYLLSKHPRLLVSIADVCNNILQVSKDTSVYQNGIPRSKKDDYEKIKSIYKKLFLDCSGSVIVCGSQPGYLSYANSSGGGLLTLSFSDTLTKSAQEPETSWDSIMTTVSLKTAKKAKQLKVEQTPMYEINVH